MRLLLLCCVVFLCQMWLLRLASASCWSVSPASYRLSSILELFGRVLPSGEQIPHPVKVDHLLSMDIERPPIHDNRSDLKSEVNRLDLTSQVNRSDLKSQVSRSTAADASDLAFARSLSETHCIKSVTVVLIPRDHDIYRSCLPRIVSDVMSRVCECMMNSYSIS